jgi:hypothetical protein
MLPEKGLPDESIPDTMNRILVPLALYSPAGVVTGAAKEV